MKKITIFTNETLCQEKMADLNTLANLPQEVSKTITPILKHTTLDKWFFCYSVCISPDNVNGKAAECEALIAEWIDDELCTVEEKTDQELIDEGWLPEEE